jgi:dTDP-4-dehydrorhamnose reductase
MADLDQCEQHPEWAHLLNAELPREVALRAKAWGARLIHISTDAIFDGQAKEYREDDEPSPQNVYARTKLAGENAVLDAYPEALVARVNFFGWSRTGQRSLAEFFYNKLRAGDNDLKGFTDAFFCPLLVTDLADLLSQMLDLNLNGLYHLFSCEPVSKYDFGVRIANLFGYHPGLIKPVSITEVVLEARRSPNLIMNTDKLASALGKQPPDITQGLVRWFEQHQKGYSAQLQAL